MEKLLQGIIKFKEEDFEAHKELFSELGNKQLPHTLFITCSDSRVDPNMITGSKPGDLFIIRNIANIIPPYRETSEFVATTSAIEYSVLMLGVENIIVCGHSNCGGCNSGLNYDEKLEKMPHTKKWLELLKPVSEYVHREFPNVPMEEKEWIMEQYNILEQLKHLMSYPYIKDKVAKNELQINGWYYIIETGEIFIYDFKNCEFKLAN